MNVHQPDLNDLSARQCRRMTTPIQAACHPRNADRLAALQSFKILDTPREAEFDDICALAAEICGTPVALISLVDDNRQWFKAEIGLGAAQTSLRESICSHAILQEDILEIPDTRLDARTADNPLVTRRDGFLFYAGAVLETDDGLPIGTLCILDYQPRHLTGTQKATLRVLARQVMTQLQLRRALDQQKLMAQEIDHRVKNSLQSITSIVRLQARRTGNAETRSVLNELELRIGSIALLHEELHKAGSSEQVRLDSLMGNISGYLQQGVVDSIRIESRFDPIMIGSRQASAIALLANEFTANSIKHAFPDGQAGRIGFSGTRMHGGALRIVMEDDGIGFDRRSVPGTGLGLRIMDATITQLNATIEQDADHNGVRLVITVPAA